MTGSTRTPYANYHHISGTDLNHIRSKLVLILANPVTGTGSAKAQTPMRHAQCEAHRIAWIMLHRSRAAARSPLWMNGNSYSFGRVYRGTTQSPQNIWVPSGTPMIVYRWHQKRQQPRNGAVFMLAIGPHWSHILHRSTLCCLPLSGVSSLNSGRSCSGLSFCPLHAPGTCRLKQVKRAGLGDDYFFQIAPRVKPFSSQGLKKS